MLRIGTDKGLLKINQTNAKIFRFSYKKKEVTGHVTSITDTKDGNIWFSIDGSIYCLNTTSQKVFCFSRNINKAGENLSSKGALSNVKDISDGN